MNKIIKFLSAPYSYRQGANRKHSIFIKVATTNGIRYIQFTPSSNKLSITGKENLNNTAPQNKIFASWNKITKIEKNKYNFKALLGEVHNDTDFWDDIKNIKI